MELIIGKKGIGMEQLKFKFKFSAEAEAEELFRKVRKRNPSNTISLKELIHYVHEYNAYGDEIYCTDRGMLFSRKRGSG